VECCCDECQVSYAGNHHAECQYAERCKVKVVMLSVILLGVIMLMAIILNVFIYFHYDDCCYVKRHYAECFYDDY
jgi:hypothetical protein